MTASTLGKVDALVDIYTVFKSISALNRTILLYIHDVH
jgi:hypothetical protein